MFLTIRRDFIQQTLVLLPVFVNAFCIECHIFWLSNATFYLTQPGHTPSATVSECALLGTCFNIGKLLFAWPCGMLFDKYGGKKIIVLAGSLNFLSWAMLCFCKSLNFILIARILAGSSIALHQCMCTAITGELCSPEFRGIYSTIIVLIAGSSAIFQSTISIIFNSYQSLSVSMAILSPIFYPASYFLLESPFFLASKGNLDQTKRNLEKLYPNHSSKQIEEKFDELKKLTESKSMENDQSLLQRIIKTPFKKVVFYICLIGGLIELSGIQVIRSFSTIILPNTPLIPNSYYPFVDYICTTFLQLCGLMVIEKFPRRSLFLISISVISLVWYITGTIYCLNLYKEHNLWSYIVIFEVLANLGGFSSSIIPLYILTKMELFPVGIKGIVNALAVFTRSIFAIMAYQSFVFIWTNVALYAVFYFYASVLVVLMAVVYIGLPESRGKSLVDLQLEICSTETKHCQRSQHTSYEYGTFDSDSVNNIITEKNDQ